jgi:hypothetical protein
MVSTGTAIYRRLSAGLIFYDSQINFDTESAVRSWTTFSVEGANRSVRRFKD